MWLHRPTCGQRNEWAKEFDRGLIGPRREQVYESCGRHYIELQAMQAHCFRRPLVHATWGCGHSIGGDQAAVAIFLVGRHFIHH
jgi:hypothetical protein